MPKRFIPTGVGNTQSRRVGWLHAAVHPHGRGEHTDSFVMGSRFCGSSPRAWGTPSTGAVKVFNTRFIPTGVGNTVFFSLLSICSTVHPHGRGEHERLNKFINDLRRFIPTGVGNTSILAPLTVIQSVHPHGRGEHWFDALADEIDRKRFIPTGVGNTCARVRESQLLPVHPHGRGEHVSIKPAFFKYTGSSPRAWGTR